MRDFERELLKGIGGKYEFKKGISIATHSEYPWFDWRAVEKHELIHSELMQMSVFGCFQRLMLVLKDSTAVPSDHQVMYGKAWNEMLGHSFTVHEGIASYREMLWYSAWTDGLEAMIAQMSPDYRDAFDLVSKFMPSEFASDPDPSLQAAYHAICDIAGVFLLDAPLIDTYRDWSLLGKDELQFITREGPDHRLQELVSRRDAVEPILRRALFNAKDILVTDLAMPGNHLSPQFWSFFSNTLAVLAEALPDMPTTKPSEKSGAIMKLLSKWDEDRIPHPFAVWLKEKGNHSPPWGSVDVGITELLYNVRFAPLNVRAMLANYEKYTIGTPLEYIGRIAEITNSQGLALMICACNPSNLEIPITKGQTLLSDSILGELFYVSLEHLKAWGVCFPNKTCMRFAFRFSVLQSVEYSLLHKFKVVRYMNVAHYRMIDGATFANSCPCIIRVTEFADFLELIRSEVFDYCALWEMRSKNIMSFALVRQNRLYFYPANFYQRYECEKILGRQDAGSPNTLSMSIGDNERLSMAQILALAFFGMELGINRIRTTLPLCTLRFV